MIVKDSKKRLTTQQALQHPWVTGKAANFTHMDTAQKKLQEFNARRKLKVGKFTLRRACIKHTAASCAYISGDAVISAGCR